MSTLTYKSDKVYLMIPMSGKSSRIGKDYPKYLLPSPFSGNMNILEHSLRNMIEDIDKSILGSSVEIVVIPVIYLYDKPGVDNSLILESISNTINKALGYAMSRSSIRRCITVAPVLLDEPTPNSLVTILKGVKMMDQDYRAHFRSTNSVVIIANSDVIYPSGGIDFHITTDYSASYYYSSQDCVVNYHPTLSNEWMIVSSVTGDTTSMVYYNDYMESDSTLIGVVGEVGQTTTSILVSSLEYYNERSSSSSYWEDILRDGSGIYEYLASKHNHRVEYVPVNLVSPYTVNRFYWEVDSYDQYNEVVRSVSDQLSKSNSESLAEAYLTWINSRIDFLDKLMYNDQEVSKSE